MNNKKELDVKSVHKFTQNALMKFRPINLDPVAPVSHTDQGMVSKMSNMFSNIISVISPKNKTSIQGGFGKNKTYSKSAIIEEPNDGKSKSYIEPRGSISKIEGVQNQESPSKSKRGSTRDLRSGIDIAQLQADIKKQQIGNTLIYLQKISSDTFLIGNQNQLDLITITGIYQSIIDTDVNWSLNVKKKIKKLSIDSRKCLMALQCDGQVLIYKYDNKKFKEPPSFINKAKLLGQSKFLQFLKDNQFSVFYANSATIYQIEQNNALRLIFNKKYPVGQKLTLFQIPKPIQYTLNIFFKEKSMTSQTHILWRLELQCKTLTFKTIQRVYDIPNGLVNKFRIDNFARDIFIMNFKFQILAAKDGYIIDSANTNIQQDGSCLVYHGDHLLHVSEQKLFIYTFKIVTNTKPNKIDIKSIDSIQINKDARYMFFDCLEMLNGNFVLFFQVKPECNKKMRGEIDYIITVTQKLSIQQKLNEIFSFKSADELKTIAQNCFQKIQEKCDIAFKIGLNRRQVYLQLWNKSNKKDIQDYKFLLDTMDYQTIKHQIQKKLKKNSMSFNQVFKLEQGCFDMLKTDLFVNCNCSETAIKNYLISHFLLRKLAFFRDEKVKCKMSSNQQNKAFTIDIQQYFSCIKMDLKSMILDYASKICFEEKDYSKELRLFIRSFKFPLRIIYPSILQDLIILCKAKLIIFLKAIPQILPYVHHEIPQGQQPSLFEGIWSEIKTDQWTSNLHVEEISTIYNRDYVTQLTKTVWFKRNQYTLHDLVPLSKQRIIQIQQYNQSQNIFYYFIEKLFENNKDENNLTEVVDFLQSNYVNLPIHLKDQIFLYRKLYNYFMQEKYNNTKLSSFNSFLKMKDYELLKEMFKYQKIKKGCLLKDCRSIYNSVENGSQLYNDALLHYFGSDLSEISDLKYILNRMNSQKRQFHIQNQSIYQVLVKGIQMKLKLGSDNDIPFDEVMIYIQNIPLSKNNPVIGELQRIQTIGQQSQRFKKMKLNMSFYEMIERFEDVLTAMINYEIKTKKVLEMRDEQQLKAVTYTILAEVQTVKQKIYQDKVNDLAYFIYISKLLEVKELIKYANLLLQDQYLLAFYFADETMIQNLVIYMYRWKLIRDPVFVKNQEYLHQLLTLLPQNNIYRIYFKNQIQFSILMSIPENPIQFRSATADTILQNNTGAEVQRNQNLITIKEIAEIVDQRSVNFLMNLNIQRIYELVKTMQELSFTQQNILNMTHLTQIYQVIIIRLIKLNSCRNAIPLIRKLIQLFGEQENYCIVFCYTILNVIIQELAQTHKQSIAKLAFYLFNQPLLLLDIIQKRINNKLSNDEEEAFIQAYLQKVKVSKCYNKNNFLIDKDIIAKINEKEDKYSSKFQHLIFQSWIHLNKNREDFIKNYQYTFVYIMLLNNPYALAKYIHIRQQTMNIRILRSYLSYIFRQDIFNGIDVLYYSKRMFTIIYNSVMQNIPLQLVIAEYKGVDLQIDEFQFDVPKDIEVSNPFGFKIYKSIIAFSSKLDSLKIKQTDNRQIKKRRIDALLSSQASINQEQASQYPFNDSDDNYEEDKGSSQFVQIKTKKKSQRVFDANKERKLLFESRNQNTGLFLSLTGQDMQQLRKTSPSHTMLKSAKSFQHGFKSLRFGKKERKASVNVNGNGMDLDMGSSSNKDFINDNPGMDLAASQSQQDFLFKTMQPRLQRPNNREDKVITSARSFSPQRQSQREREYQQINSQVDQKASPLKMQGKNSVIDIGMDLGESLDIQELGFRVFVNEVNDQKYTSVNKLRKQLQQDYGDNETEPMFNMSLIANEEEKEFGQFDQYLKELIVNIYESQAKSMFLNLSLIKQIKTVYPKLKISNQFLQIFISLQSYNIKYKYNLPIRNMFPIDAIFLQSKDPKILFHYVKERIIPEIDFDNIMIVAKLIHFAFKRSEIKDQLYCSYLENAISQYGRDTGQNQEELLMQKQRIGGIIDQVTMASIFLDRGEALLKSVKDKKRDQIIQMIKDALKKKKKEDLIPQLLKKIGQS